MKEKIIVTFSGGRTSGYMCKWLIDNMSHLYELVFVYANAGQEHNKTLEFVDKCDREFNLNLIWLEGVFHEGERKSSTHKIVNFKTACRYNSKNNVFEDMVKKYGLPNQSYPHCTRELKLNPINSWMKDNGLKDCRRVLGIRCDEIKRFKMDLSVFYPFIHLAPKNKNDVIEWWSKQDFDLEIEEHEGNCLTCFKKSNKKLKLLATENPEYFEFFSMLEKKYTHLKSNFEIPDRIIFRGHRTTKDVLNNIGSEDFDDICVEECGTFNPDFETKEITDQLNLFK